MEARKGIPQKFLSVCDERLENSQRRKAVKTRQNFRGRGFSRRGGKGVN